MIVSSVGRLLANVSAPIAALFAMGYLAQVMNIWLVSKRNYDFSFIAAWHVASVIDRTVVIGIGLKYFFIFWPIAALILFLAALWRRQDPDNPLMRFWNGTVRTLTNTSHTSSAASPLPSTSTFFIGSSTPVYFGGQALPTSNEDKADGSTWWLGSLLLAVVLTLAYLFFIGGLSYLDERIHESKTIGELSRWNERKKPEDREVLSYLPYVNMSVAGSTEPTPNSVGSDGQPFTGTAKPSSNGGDGTYTITGSINPASSNPQDETKVEGTLLSHNADYWYVFAEEGTQGSKDRRILVIPADAASEICVVKGTPEQELDQDRDCTY